MALHIKDVLQQYLLTTHRKNNLRLLVCTVQAVSTVTTPVVEPVACPPPPNTPLPTPLCTWHMVDDYGPGATWTCIHRTLSVGPQFVCRTVSKQRYIYTYMCWATEYLKGCSAIWSQLCQHSHSCDVAAGSALLKGPAPSHVSLHQLHDNIPKTVLKWSMQHAAAIAP